ncbi:sensor histidine kinase [Pseudoxanthomonas gei]|uniref:Sensor histidine kinase n=1 Tax=Pseudoxanthomonas gei TaxID=1383030 RepID=A0ABX0AIF1_9GAMM|nr:histidine kinase [Pseudoxanthomonas gei]NDK39266.1 sensor histidine kinase [Pseudoxanthomonas gei]
MVTGTGEPWVPDFCRRPRVLVMLGMAELVVVVVALWPAGKAAPTLSQFVSASALSLWIALAVAVLLCMLRRPLSRLPHALGAAVALALVGAIALFAAGVVYALYNTLGTSAMNVGFWRFLCGSAAIAVLMTALLLRYFYVIDRWSAQVNANARAEADALQARIRPHFLFNSMNLIASLVRRDPEVAERAVLDLSDLFRAALGVNDGDSSLLEEVELAKRYLSIESLRMGHRLQVEWRLGDQLPWSLRLPHLMLQPLVENAVLHGISRLPEGGKVDIAIWTDEENLHFGIGNPTPPPQFPGLALQRGTGHAQRNIAYRLKYKFGMRARLSGAPSDGGYECEVVVPLDK